MALGTIADHLSPQAGLIEGRKQRGQGEGLGWWGGLLPAHPIQIATTPAPAWGLYQICLGAQGFYLRIGEQAWGSQATRSTPRPWESSTKGSRIPSRRDLWVERSTIGEPCLGRARRKCHPTPLRGKWGSAGQFFL